MAIVIKAIAVSANPAMRLLKGLDRLGKMDAFTVTSTLSVNYKGDDDDLKLINQAGASLKTAVNLDKMLAEVTGTLSYDKKKTVAEITAGLGEKEVYFALPKLYDKTFTYRLDKQVRAYISEIQVLLKYLREADVQYDRGKYAKAIAEVLDDDIKGSPGKVMLTLDGDRLLDIFAEIFEVAADDEVLMKSLRKNAKNAIEKILKDKHEFELLFDVEDLEYVLEYLQDDDDFEIAYMYIVREMKDSFRYLSRSFKYYADDIPELDVTIDFGLLSSNIRGISIAMEIEDSGETVVLSLDSEISRKASIGKINTKSTVDIEDLMDDPAELEDIAETVLKNLAKNIKSNKKLVNAIDDLTGMDVDDLMDLLMDEIF
ncbi:MAG TPA: hypothetical protein PLO77_06325 [Thermoclostridium caenicola]|nr:hypothetical protein [Thermoclostridium caenicola]